MEPSTALHFDNVFFASSVNYQMNSRLWLISEVWGRVLWSGGSAILDVKTLTYKAFYSHPCQKFELLKPLRGWPTVILHSYFFALMSFPVTYSGSKPRHCISSRPMLKCDQIGAVEPLRLCIALGVCQRLRKPARDVRKSSGRNSLNRLDFYERGYEIHWLAQLMLSMSVMDQDYELMCFTY